MKNRTRFLAGLFFFMFTILLAVLVVAISLGTAPGVQMTTNATTTTTGSIWYNGTFAEDTTYILNITFNNTLNSSSGGNITYINITMPGKFYYYNTSNATAVGNTTNVTTDVAFTFNVTNVSGNVQVLNWSNNTKGAALGAGLIDHNDTVSSFMFNVTSPEPGTYNMSVYWMLNYSDTGGAGASVGHENISIVVNDTTNITEANWTTSANDVFTPNSNLSATGIRANLTFSDNGQIGNINITLQGPSGLVIDSAADPYVNATNGTGGYSFYDNLTNSTGLPDGTYTINVTYLNDTYGNNLTNSTGGVATGGISTQHLIRNITLDTLAPTVSYSCTPSTDVNVGESVTCTCSGSDATTGVRSTVFNTSGYSAEARDITQTCKITDYANNSKTQSLTYTVYSSGNGAGGSGGGGGSATATKTVVLTDEQFEAGHTTQLKADEQARVRVNGINHYVSVDAVSETTVKITVSSDPQEATLSIGDTRKFDSNSDGMYDVSVTLNSITGGKADLTILSISEEVTAESEAEQEGADEKAAEEAAGEEPIVEDEGSNIWIWIIVIVVVLIIVGVIVAKRKK